ncbi:MAG: 2-oxoacid:acceptor oxidoreductase family protein [Nitrososphaerota archaeon]|nr:2-oxoacid:acceptor oxidoreductase family protein [Nitrososphaerota archaeon]
MKARILVSGRGGLGVVEMGNMIAYLFMSKGLSTTVVPTYGPQTRGGFVESIVVIQDERVLNPIPTKFDMLIAMDVPALGRIKDLMPYGTIFFNSSLVDGKWPKAIRVPATEIAEEVARNKMREPRVTSNVSMLGAFAKIMQLGRDSLNDTISNILSDKTDQAIKLNIDIANAGYNYAEKELPGIKNPLAFFGQ